MYNFPAIHSCQWFHDAFTPSSPIWLWSSMSSAIVWLIRRAWAKAWKNSKKHRKAKQYRPRCSTTRGYFFWQKYFQICSGFFTLDNFNSEDGLVYITHPTTLNCDQIQLSNVKNCNKSSPPSMFINKLEAVLLHFGCLAHLETIHIYTPRCFCVLDVKEVTNAHVCTIQQNMNFTFFQIHSIPDGIVTLKCHYIIVFPQNDTSG